MRLRVVTWNLHSCVGTDGVYDPARVAEVLARLDADVIGLQEVDWRKSKIDGRDQFEFLADALGMTPIEGPNLEDRLGHYGNGLLTRLEVAGVERLELAHAGREPRGLIDAALVSGDHRLRVLVTHLGLSRSERRAQLRRVVGHLERTAGGGPSGRVLLADLNEWLPTSFVQRLGFGRYFSDEVCPRTFPTRMPVFRLDRVLAGGVVVHDDACPDVPAGLRRASDHLPVCVEITVGDEVAE